MILWLIFVLNFWLSRIQTQKDTLSHRLGKACVGKLGKAQHLALGKAMSCGRGGARHFAKPLVDADVIFNILSTNSKIVADLGSYEHLSKTYAPDPKGLMHCLDLWKALLKAEPSGSCHVRPLRQALLSLLVQNPHLNTTTHSGEVWANLRVERITCLLMHVRKVKRDGLQALCAAKLSREDMALFDHGLHLLELPPLEKGGQSAALETASALEKAESSALEKANPENLAIVPFVSENKKKRKLREKSSDPSVDALGFPKMFDCPKQFGKAVSQAASPAPANRKKRRTGQRVLENSQNPHSSLGYGGKKTVPKKKRPAASLEKVAAANKHLKESKCSKKEKSLGKDSTKKRQKWFRLYTTWPKNPERGYITGIQKEGDKKVLIVEVTLKMSQYYQDIVADIRDALEKESITKAEAVSMRSELLLAYNSAL